MKRLVRKLVIRVICPLSILLTLAKISIQRFQLTSPGLDGVFDGARTPNIESSEDVDTIAVRHRGCRTRRLSVTRDLDTLKRFYSPKTLKRLQNCSSIKHAIDVVDGKFHYLVDGVTCRGIMLAHQVPNRVSQVSIGVLREGQEMPGVYAKAHCEGFRPTGLINLVRNESLVAAKKKLLKPSNPNLDVIMVGFDSSSHAAMEYMLPKTMRLLRDEFKSVVLNDYNIVGDGTPQALIPMFTGKTELELPLTRKENKSALFVDEAYPLIHFDFAKHGYITSYVERGSDHPTFGLRLCGFKLQPTDIYSYPLYQSTEGLYPEHCYRNLTETAFHLSIAEQLQRSYWDVPKFLFIFNDLTHDSQDSLKLSDDYLTSFLADLAADKPRRNRTVFILMSDHGPRFSEMRSSYEGRLEERSPMFAIALPDRLRTEFPAAWKNLAQNENNLVTPFDIHHTLQHLLHGLPVKPALGSKRARGISLFDSIPEERTCEDAGIDYHWCTCMEETALNVTDNRNVSRVVDAVVNKINELLLPVKDDCHAKVTLASVLEATLLSPRTELLKFSGSLDKHGTVFGFEDDVRIANHTVRIVFQTEPGATIYEATVKASPDFSTTEPDSKSMSRLNKYGSRPHCIAHRFPNLREYCVCHDKL